MPDREQRDDSLAGLVVKEAVERGMETEFRDQIVEAVDEAEGGTTPRVRRVPLAGALVGLGAAIGYLVGRGEAEGTSVMEGTPLEDVDPSEIVEDVAETTEATEPETTESETEGGGRGRLLGTLALVAGVVAGLAFLRRRRSGEEEWEPIEEFEPASDAEFGEDEEEAEATTDEGADEPEEETEE